MQNFLYIAGGIAFILFFVGLWLSYRTWRIHTLLLLPAVFIMAVVFFCLAVQTLKTHQQWGQTKNKLKKEVELVQQRNKDLEFGVKQQDDKIVKEGIKQLKERLVDTTRDRGRMWLGCQPSSVDPAGGEVKITVPVPKEHQIKAKMLVYAFEDRPAGGAYLGAFRVTSVIGGDAPMEEPMAETKPAEGEKAEGDKKADDKKEGNKSDTEKKDGVKKDSEKKDADKADGEKKTAEKSAEPKAPAADGPEPDSIVTLMPAWRLLPTELNRIKNSAGPWVLHDKMPVDSHESLVDVNKDPLTGAVIVDVESGKPLERESELKRLVPASVAAEYLHDYQPAVWHNPPQKGDDPPERVTVFVEFLKDYKLPSEPAPVPKAAAAEGAAPAGANGAAPAAGTPVGAGFGPGGAAAPAPGVGPGGATAPGAQAVAEFEFKRGAKAWIPVLLANELQPKGFVQIIQTEKPRYERELRDYAKLFDTYYLDRADNVNAKENLLRQNAAIVGVHEKNLALIESVTAEQARLAHDLERFKFESAALSKHAAALKQQYLALAQQWRTLFLANQQLAAKIDEQQRRAAASIDRRVPAPPQAIGIPAEK